MVDVLVPLPLDNCFTTVVSHLFEMTEMNPDIMKSVSLSLSRRYFEITETNLVIMASVSLSRRYLEMTDMNPDIMAAVTARLEEQVRFQ